MEDFLMVEILQHWPANFYFAGAVVLAWGVIG
jgi:hypothetical protein